MKKLILLLTAALLMLTVACNNTADKQTTEQKPEPSKIAQVEKPAPNPTAKKDSNRMTPVVEAVSRSEEAVVNIRAEIFATDNSPFFGDSLLNNEFLKDFFGYKKPQNNQSLGSGVLIDNEGIVITNYHVVKDADRITVGLFDDKVYSAQYIGGDEILDIAVLKIRGATGLPAAVTGDSDDIMLGETVIAMGNPYGLNSSITTGIISSKHRVINVGNGYSLFMQTDALINPGNSGGPLVNLDGEVIGINTAIFKNAQGIGFSIPINTVLRVLPEILSHGKVRMGYMGFSVTQESTGDAIKLVVSHVEKKSNASEIGIIVGDQILQVANIPVSSLQALSYMLRSYPPGTSVPVVVKRGEKTLKGRIAIDDYPEKFGLKVLENNYGLTFMMKEKFLVVASSVNSNHFKAGDILIAVNNDDVKSFKDLDKLVIDNFGETVVLSVYRDSRLIRVQLHL